MTMITLFNLFITVLVYLFTRFLSKRYQSPLTNPVFLSTVIIIAILLMAHVSYDEYVPAKNMLTFLLGPATVALALPIYKNRDILSKYLSAAFIGLFFGSVMTILSAVILAKIFHFSKVIILSFTVKSVTVPVATEIGKIVNGNLSLIAAVVIITGMIGAMFGLKFLQWFKIDHPFARGLSIGTIAHGIGTAEAVKEGEIQGAVAGAAMGIAAVLTSFVIPYIIPYLL
ncbi:LrgB family protein [Neobacillus pocheonensis]|uniref:LrgB family protein n=1 Tax=Neobacillus pocheonensis TaxID=363869 RepID=UPI003D2ACC07